MGEVEMKCVRTLGERGFASRTVFKSKLDWITLQIVGENRPQPAPSSDKTVAVPLKMEAACSDRFIRRKHARIGREALPSRLKTCRQDVDFASAERPIGWRRWPDNFCRSHCM